LDQLCALRNSYWFLTVTPVQHGIRPQLLFDSRVVNCW